jgi:23S rRNA pseudouridine955/2504/2580 synthase
LNRLKGVPKSAIYRIIRTGQVRVNGQRSKPSRKLSVGDEVRIPPVRTFETGEAVISRPVLDQITSRIVHQDNDMLVLDKPAGMAVHAGSGLSWGVIDVVRRIFPGLTIDLVHRLDRETSGILILACNGEALNHLSRLFREGELEKYYLCLMDGRLEQDRIEVDAPLSGFMLKGVKRMQVDELGKTALTQFRVLQRFEQGTYAEAELLTGRTHQIRVHAAHTGHALAGDRKYSSAESQAEWRKLGLSRLFLHAHRMVMKDRQGKDMELSVPLEPELKVVLDKLEE